MCETVRRVVELCLLPYAHLWLWLHRFMLSTVISVPNSVSKASSYVVLIELEDKRVGYNLGYRSSSIKEF
jgi:hypothetical protein